MSKWIVVICGALATGAVALMLVVGVALWQGASLAARVASVGIEQARAALEQAAPPEAREQARARLDATIAALRDGRFDREVLAEAAWWLPGALADGQLDASEKQALWGKLDRLTPASPKEDSRARS